MRGWSLVTRLIVAVVAIATLSAALSVAVLRVSARDSLRDQALARNNQVAARLAALVDETVASHVSALALAATHGSVVALEAGSTSQLNVILRSLPTVESLTLLDAHGVAVAATASRFLADVSGIPSRPDLAAQIEAGRGHAEVLDGGDLEIGVAVEDPPGTPVGSLVARVPVDRLTGRLEALRLGSTGTAFLVGADGRILAHRERNRVVAGEVYPIEDGQTLGDAQHLVSVASTTTLSGAVVVEQEASDAVVGLDAGAGTLSLVALGTVLLMALSIIIVTRFALRPLDAVAHAIDRFAVGDQRARAPVGGDRQIAAIAEQFNVMADSLEHQMSELEGSNRALMESERRFWTGFDNAPIGMVIVGMDGAFQRVNAAMCELLGRDEDELLRLGFPDVTHPSDVGMSKEHVLRVREGDGGMIEKRYLRPDGTVVWALLSATVMNDAEGRPIGFFSQAVDVTERHRAEEALRESERMYAEWYEREREAAVQLRKLDEMKNMFLTAVSHELRTPLTGVIGFAHTLHALANDAWTIEEREMLVRLMRNAERLEGLLADLLDLDRLARGVIDPQVRRSDVSALIQLVIQQMEVLDKHRVHLDLQPVLAEIDPAMFERITENLLANAVKYTPPGTDVWVRIRAREAGLELIVEDEGPGVDPAVREIIFEVFERGEQVQDHAPGTGVGLTLVARFAALHGGRAWVEDRPGGGASFHVLLPGDVTDLPHAEAGAG